MPVIFKASSIDKSSSLQPAFLIIVHYQKNQENIYSQSLTEIFRKFPFPVLRISKDGIILNANKGSWIILTFWQRNIGEAAPLQFMKQLNNSLKIEMSNEIELQVGFKIFLLIAVSGSLKEYIDLFGFDITQRKQIRKKTAS